MRRGTMQQRQYLFDGLKAVRIDDLPDSAWTWFTSRVTEGEADAQTYYHKVPWLNRAVALRSQAVSSLPFALLDAEGEDYDTSKDWQNKCGFLSNPRRVLYLIEAALSLLGEAYLFRERNRVKTLNLRYLLPTSVTPIFAEDSGLVAFTRQLSTGNLKLMPEDIVYFWQLDPFVELGPGNNSPAMAALSAAGVLYNVDKFAESFFKRGAIKVTLLTVEGSPQEQEKQRLKAWWQKVFSGIDRSWQTEIVSATVKPQVIGEGIQELADSELTKEKREDIAAAMGIPMTLLWSTQASGLGGGGVVGQDDLHFYDKTIVPEAELIAGVLNEQVFSALGLCWKFQPETLDVFQEDEAARAEALMHYVTAGFSLEIAGQMLGLELPPGITWEQLAAEKEGRRQEMAEQMQSRQPPPPPPGQPPTNQPPEETAKRVALLADLKRWKTKALKKGGAVPFESEFIPADVKSAIQAALRQAANAEEIRQAFDNWEGQPVSTVIPFLGWEGYP